MEDDLNPADKEPLVTTPATSRRSLLKGAGVAAGGLAALGALGAVGAANATAAGATPGPDVPYPGAPSLAAFLTANGSPISGDNTREGRENSIECVYYEQKSATAYNAASGAASGKRQYQPLVIRKPVDSSTPILHRALAQNQAIDGAFKFYRNGDGSDFNYYTVNIKQGRIISIDEWSPDNQSTDGQQGISQPMEEVSISFNSIQ